MTTLTIILLCAGGLLLLIATFCMTAALRGEDRLAAIMDTPTSSALDIQAIHRVSRVNKSLCKRWVQKASSSPSGSVAK